jgi:hypothetical protein
MHDEQNLIAQFAWEIEQGKEYNVPRSIIRIIFPTHTQTSFWNPNFSLEAPHNFWNMSNPRFFYHSNHSQNP